MNRLPAVITRLELSDGLCLMEVEAGALPFFLLLFDLKPGFKEGRGVNILFKESEVALAVGLAGELSHANRFGAAVREIKKGPLLSRVVLACPAGEIVSLITTAA